MKKLAILFILAVVIPCGVLAWLAVRAMREEESTSERQRVALAEQKTERTAERINSFLAAQIHELESKVDEIMDEAPQAKAVEEFDQRLRTRWRLAQVGFVLDVHGAILAPKAEPQSAPHVAAFHRSNGVFFSTPEPRLAYALSFDDALWNNPEARRASTVAQQLPPSAQVGEEFEPETVNKSLAVTGMGGGGNANSPGFLELTENDSDQIAAPSATPPMPSRAAGATDALAKGNAQNAPGKKETNAETAQREANDTGSGAAPPAPPAQPKSTGDPAMIAKQKRDSAKGGLAFENDDRIPLPAPAGPAEKPASAAAAPAVASTPDPDPNSTSLPEFKPAPPPAPAPAPAPAKPTAAAMSVDGDTGAVAEEKAKKTARSDMDKMTKAPEAPTAKIRGVAGREVQGALPQEPPSAAADASAAKPAAATATAAPQTDGGANTTQPPATGQPIKEASTEDWKSANPTVSRSGGNSEPSRQLAEKLHETAPALPQSTAAPAPVASTGKMGHDDALRFQTPTPSSPRRSRDERSADSPAEGMAALADAPEPVKTELRTVQPEHLSSSQRALARHMSSVTAQPVRLPDLWAEQRSGILSRLAPDGGISVFVWCRPAAAPDMIFGAQLALGELGGLLTQVLRRESEESEEFCLALLDHAGNPVGKTLNGFAARWSAPYVSTEIGRALPRWEAAAFLLDPSAAGRAARSGRWRLGLLVVAVLAAALAGGALLWRDARRRALDARQKADFVSNVSHELRTPLTSIRMFSDLLANPDASPTPDKTRKYAEVISREASRLTRLINTVLDFSRFERGKAQLHCEELDLRTLTEELLDNYRPQIESAGFELRCELPADPLLVKGDRDRLAQVLLNLLSNAEKYGGGQRKEIAVTLHTDLQRNAAVLTVADRGPGVPKGKERRIFEKFFRAEDALASGVQGSGLGLTLARQIAQAHGGDVTCTRRDGGGSLFSVCIPLTSESHSPMPT